MFNHVYMFCVSACLFPCSCFDGSSFLCCLFGTRYSMLSYYTCISYITSCCIMMYMLYISRCDTCLSEPFGLAHHGVADSSKDRMHSLGAASSSWPWLMTMCFFCFCFVVFFFSLFLLFLVLLSHIRDSTTFNSHRLRFGTPTPSCELGIWPS